MTMVEPPIGRLLNKLSNVKRKSGGGWMARCPVTAAHKHGDHNPSLSIDVQDGKILLKCFAGCTADAILSAIAMTIRDLFTDVWEPAPEPIPLRQRAAGRPAAVYQYRDHRGNIVAEKGRFDLPDGKKTFRWRPIGATSWSGLESTGLALTDLALWGAEDVAEAPQDMPIFFCEGEKATLACRERGLVAVTFAGGASTRDFGPSLEILRGRNVALWPDNDGPGREYMRLVQTRLQGSAASIVMIAVPVPPKGDAYDYFNRGGSVADLDRGTIPLTSPMVEVLSDDGIRVTLPTTQGRVLITCADIERSRRDFDCEFILELDAPGQPRDAYTERINLLSHSAREALRRDLDNIHGKEWSWSKLLNTAFGLVRETYAGMDRSVDLAEVQETSAELFFLKPLLPQGSATIFFGDGSSLKSYTALTLAAAVALGCNFLSGPRGDSGFHGPQGPVLLVDYEDNAENIHRRMRRIVRGLGFDDVPEGLIRYYPARGIPLKDLVPSLKKVISEFGIILVIIDSIGPACGGEPEKSESALSYFRALSMLGVTTLNIAHITKVEAGKANATKYPFGSIYWSNMARRTWYVARVQEEESDIYDVGLYCRKVNDGPTPRPIAIRVRFDGYDGPVFLESGNIAEVQELQQKREARYQVIDALRGGPLTAAAIASVTGLIEDSVKHLLSRNAGDFVQVGTTPRADGKPGKPAALWGLLDQHQPSTPEQFR